MRIAFDNNLVPNFTTSGFGMPPEIASMCKRYCGALAVSLYRSKYAENAIQVLLAAGVKTNSTMYWERIVMMKLYID